MSGQLRALVTLRWRMIRSRQVQVGLLLLAACIPLAAVVVVGMSRQIPVEQSAGIGLVAPTMFLSAAVLALLAPLAVGGGNELYPADQLVAYPIRPATTFTVSVLLAPLNLAWLAQLLGLLGVTGVITGSGPRLLLALATTCSYFAFVTVAGQALAWFVVGVRQTRGGRIAVWSIAAVVALAVVVVAAAGLTTEALDRSPLTGVVLLVLIGYGGSIGSWATGMGLLLAATALAALVGAWVCGWTLSRSREHGVHQNARPLRRRAPQLTAFAELTAVDRASVWRSVPLRRGILVLGLLPGLVAAAAGISWSSIVMLPGLVAAGSGLLFGVNAFCLDASGAVWLASLPHNPQLALFAKARVLAEVCVGAVLLAVLAAAVRAPEPPTMTQVTAVLASAVACITSVVATCMLLSVRRPHRADLRGARDIPAPPGSMAVYSVRLSAMTTLTAIMLSLVSYATPWPWLPLVVAVPLTVRALLALLRIAREWDDPGIRAQVVTSVASG